jgi:biopolymer transport protein ExbB
MITLLNKGGPVMYPLLLCSWLSLTVILERILFWYQDRKRKKKDAIERIFNNIKVKNIAEAVKLANSSDDRAVKMLLNGLNHSGDSVKEAMEIAIISEEEKINKGLSILSTIITVSPLLGILGTVTGIIYSFQILGSVSIGTPKVVTEGIAQALLTTAFGLAIAIFTLIPYSYFQNKSENTIREMEEYGTRLELLLKNKQID